MTVWKNKLALLNHKMKLAKNIKNALELSVEKNPETEMKEQPAKIAKEKGFIQAVANIPSYKSSEYYHLELINSKTKNMDVTEKGHNALIHNNTMKRAKSRLAQVITRLMNDIRKEK